jgi:exodeoxyribonuclease VII small subunit
MATENNSFREAYGVLQQHAETLRQQREPNIDDLLSIVEESVKAYKTCKARIDAVEKALEKALTDVGADANLGADLTDNGDAPDERGAAVTRTLPGVARAKPSTGFDDMDDDIPF